MRTFIQCCQYLLILLWIYAGCIKLLDYRHTRAEMMLQIFDASFAGILAWLVPVTEIITGLLLAVPLTTRYGLVLSALLLFVFTVYVSGGLLNWYESRPCSCGGVLEQMSWGWHFVFNLFFLALNSIAIVFNYKKEVW
jgi:putative oxidoreductase